MFDMRGEENSSPETEMHIKLLIALIALSCAACQPSHNLGYTSATVQVDGRQPISLSIWYPTESGETGSVVQSDIFQGQRASRDAPPLPSQYPLVLLSHGDSTTNRNLGSWLSARLARSGFIVGEFGPIVDEETSDVDLSFGYHASFAHMRNDPIWQSRIDFDQIAVVGFGHTGATVLSSFDEVVGVPVGESPCPVDRSPDSRGCEFSTVSNPAADGLTEGATLSQEPLNSMVRAVVALNPQFEDTFILEDFQTQLPTQVITLGGQLSLPFATERLWLDHLSDAVPVDLLPLCHQNAAGVLLARGESTIDCTGGSILRDQVHSEVYDLVMRFLVSKLLFEDYYNGPREAQRE